MKSLFVLLALFLSVPAFAQLDRGSLTGSVTDKSGARIPNVRLNIENPATGARYQTVANEVGQFTVPNLPAGTYTVAFTADGFRKLVRSNVELGATDVVRIDAVLDVGQVSDAVSVTAEVPKLQTDAPEVSATLGGKQLVDLPLAFAGDGRMAETLAYKIMPGISGDTWRSSANGSTAFSKESLLDGATVATYLAGHMGESHVPVEALQEFKVQTSGMSAEFGRAQGGVFNYVMKSGNNEVHGSVYAGLRNEALNANTFANNFAGRKRPLERKQAYVGAIGGPVYIPKVYNGRNKTFFYTTFERSLERQRGLGNANVTLPVPEFYQGDFSRILGGALSGTTDALNRPVYKGAIYDPASFRQIGNRWVGDMFPGNKIPSSRFSQVSKNLNAIASKYQPSIKDPNGNIALQNNAYGPLTSKPELNTWAFTLKADQNINEKQKLSGSYSYNAHPRLRGAGGFWDPNDLETGGILSTTIQQRTKAQMGRLAHDYTISPTVLNHAIVYYNRMASPNWSVHHDTDGAALLGIKGLTSAGIPKIDWGSGPIYTLTNPGEPQYGNGANYGWGFMDSVSAVKGRHFLKAGFDLRGNGMNTRGGFYPTLTFKARATAIPNETYSATYTGFSFASYLLGIVDTASLAEPLNLGGRRRYMATYLQDDFKVSSNLTLNLGLRWEVQFPGTEAGNRYASWSPSVKDPATGLMGAYEFAGDCSGCTGRNYFGSKSYRDFGPRLGFAWRASSKWTLRGAYGIMYEADLFNGYDPVPLGKQNAPFVTGTYHLSADAVKPWAGIFNWDSGFPQDRYVPAIKDPSWGNKNKPGMIDPSYGHSPYVQMWNLNIQRQLASKLVLDVGYIANKGTGLHNGDLMRLNQLPASVLTRYGKNLTNAVTNEAQAAANGVAYPFSGYKGTVAGALRQFPQLNGTDTVKMYGSPLGFSTYHSLQTTLNKEFSHGLTMYVNYVWAKSLTNTESSFVGDNAGPLDYYNLALEKAVSADSYPHTFKGFVDYQLPFGKGQKFLSGAHPVVNAILGGWGLSAIVNYRSGSPLGFSASSPSPGWNGGNRPNIAAADSYVSGSWDPAHFLYGATSANNQYLDKALFTDPGALTLGTSATRYVQIRGFMLRSEDISLQKTHHFGERARLEIRADFLNAFNRHQFDGPNTTVTSATFGQVSSVSGNRSVQLGARVDF